MTDPRHYIEVHSPGYRGAFALEDGELLETVDFEHSDEAVEAGAQALLDRERVGHGYGKIALEQLAGHEAENYRHEARDVLTGPGSYVAPEWDAAGVCDVVRGDNPQLQAGLRAALQALEAEP